MISAEKRKQIRLLLRKGLPQREVAKRAGVSNGTVSNIARFPRKQQKLPPRPRIISPCLICHKSEVPELLRIVNDLQEFHKLALISHPLLSELAYRARKVLSKILPGDK